MASYIQYAVVLILVLLIGGITVLSVLYVFNTPFRVATSSFLSAYGITTDAAIEQQSASTEQEMRTERSAREQATTSETYADRLTFIDDPARVSITDPDTLTQQVQESDIETYEQLRSDLSAITLSFIKNDTISGVRFGPHNYIDLYNAKERPDTTALFDSYEEDLVALTSYFNEKYAAYPKPTERHEAVTELRSYPTPAIAYPPPRVVIALGAERFFKLVDPENAATYDGASDAYIDRGIAYSMYLPSDVAAAREMIDQYIALVTNDTEFQLQLAAAQDEF